MDNVVPAGPPSLVLRDLRCPRSAPAPEERRSCRAEPHASRSWQKPGQTVLQSHAGETESSALRQRASSGAQSVIFKEPFGGQEASGEEQWGEGEPPEHLNNKPPHLVLQPEFHAAVNRGCVRGRQMARAAPIRCSPPLPRASSLPPCPPSSPLLSPPSATISHWLWGDGVDCRHWPCPLVGTQPGAS